MRVISSTCSFTYLLSFVCVACLPEYTYLQNSICWSESQHASGNSEHEHNFFQNFMWMCDAWAGVWQNIYQLLNMWKSVRSIDRLCFLLDLTDILKVEILLDNTSGKITIPAGFKYSQVMYLFWHTPPVPHRQGTRYSWDGAKFCQLSSSFSFLFIFW